MKLPEQMRRPRNREWLTVQQLGLILLVLAIVNAVVGYALTHPGPLSFQVFMADFYPNVSTELLSIATTVLIIDTLNQRRDARQEAEHERDALARQLGSRLPDVTARAVEEARKRGFLVDGSMQERDFQGANLEGAKLWKADFQGADFKWARMKNTNLNAASLIGCRFVQANLQTAELNSVDARGANFHEAKFYRAACNRSGFQHADFTGAHMEGAKLHNADLRGALFTRAFFDETTIMPDKQPWTAETDLRRFTDPDHPQFYTAEARYNELKENADVEEPASQNAG